jgi:glucans biosynthesis protein
MVQKNREQPHKRWILKNGNKPIDLLKLPKCKAIAKGTQKKCCNPAMKGKRVCYIHGGKSPGAPKGNKNAFKHGYYTTEAIAERRCIKLIISQINERIAIFKITA